MAECSELVEVFVQLDKNASFPSSNSSFSPRAVFDSPSEGQVNSELQKKAAGFNQNMSHTEMTNARMHEPLRKRAAKRMVNDAGRNWQSKKPRLFLDTASQPRCSKPHLFEQLHHKTPLAVLNECRKGLVVVCKRHKISHNLSFTASLELNGKMYSETGDSRPMAKQLLAETIISEMEQEIEKTHVKHAAASQAFHEKDETDESSSAADQEVLQRPPPFDTAAQGSDDTEFTSNADICSGTQSSTFGSVFTSASDQQFESSNSIAPISDNRELESKEVNIEDSAVFSAESLTFSKGNAQQRPDIIIRRTAVAILNSLIPGIKWNVTKTSRVTVESPLKEFVVSIKVNGKNFEGCSRAIYLARQYAAEAALNKLFGLELRRDVGIPLFHGKFTKIARLKKEKLTNTNFLDVHGKNPIIALNKLFKGEVSFQFHSPLVSERGIKHYCTVSVAGMTFEGRDLFKKNAKKRAAFAAVAVLRANGMYDQKVAELKARPTGLPVQQMMVKQVAPSSAVSIGSMTGARTKSRRLPVSAITRLNKVFPESRFAFQGEKMDLNLKDKIFTVDLLIGDQKFVGKGKKLKFARTDASKKALRAFGLWSDLDDQIFHGEDPTVTLERLFKGEASYEFNSSLVSDKGFKHYCTVSVAGMTFEGCDSFKKNAKKLAASAAVAVLRANGMYDQKIAEPKARPTGMPFQQMMVKQVAPSSAVNVGSLPGACTKSHSLPVSAISRLNRVFPGSRFTFKAEKMDLNVKGKIFTVDLLVGDQKFVGKGKKLRLAKVDASKKALRAFGLWSDLDDQAQALLHVPPEIKMKILEKQLARGRRKGSAALGSRRNYDYLSVDNSYFGTENCAENFGNSCFGHSDSKVRGFSERRSYKNNSIPIDVNFYDSETKQASYMGSEIERGNDGSNDILIDGNRYGNGNKQTRLMGSGVRREYNKNSNVVIDGDYYDIADEQVRFAGSGVERGYNRNSDGNYYDTGDEQVRFAGSGVERGYNKDSDGNYYDTGDEKVRFTGSGIERGYNRNSDGNYYDTGDEQVRFTGSGIERGYNRNSGGNYYDTGDEQVRFAGSGVERGYNKDSVGNYYDTGDEQVRFTGSGIERGYNRNSDGNYYDTGDEQVRFTGSGIKRGYNRNSGGNYYDTGDEQVRFTGSGIERGYDKDSDGNYYDTGDEQVRFTGSGVERGYNRNSDVIIDGNYYGTGNKQARFVGSGVERGYNKNSDGNYYDTGNEQVRFTGSGVERGYNRNSDVLIDGNYYGTGNKQARFMGSGVERGYNKSSDVQIDDNCRYYGTGSKQARFIGSGVERGCNKMF